MASLKINFNLENLKQLGFYQERKNGSYFYKNKQNCKCGSTPIVIKITQYGNIYMYCGEKQIFINKIFELANKNLLQTGKNHF